MKKLMTWSAFGFAAVAMVALTGCHFRGGYHRDRDGWHRGRPPVHGPGYGHPGHGHPGHGHGRPGRGGGHGGGHGRGPHRLMMNTTSTVADAVDVAEENPVTLLAQDFGIRMESAEKILRIAQGDDVAEAASEMNLDLVDVAPLAKLEMPSTESIDRVAKSLGEDRAKVEGIFSELISDIQAEVSASEQE